MAPKPKPTPKYRTKTRSQLDESAASTKYSPKPMSAVDKRAAGFRGATTQYQINLRKREATAAKAKLKKELKPIKSESRSKAGTATVAAIAKRFGVTAREARDIATAVGNIGAVVRDQSKTGALGGTKKQLGAAVREVKKQVGETAKAATTGKKGTASKQYMTITGDQPARLMAPGNGKRRK